MELGSDVNRASVPTIASRSGRFLGRNDADASRITGAIPRGRAPWLAVAVLVSVLVVALALAWTARSLYEHNEDRLLDSRVRELGAGPRGCGARDPDAAGIGRRVGGCHGR
jgi:hypothetical protein